MIKEAERQLEVSSKSIAKYNAIFGAWKRLSRHGPLHIYQRFRRRGRLPSQLGDCLSALLRFCGQWLLRSQSARLCKQVLTYKTSFQGSESL